MAFLITPAEIFQVKMFIVQEHCQILSCSFLTWQCPRLVQNCFKYTGLIMLLAAFSDRSQAAEASNSLLSSIFSVQCCNLFITNPPQHLTSLQRHIKNEVSKAFYQSVHKKKKKPNKPSALSFTKSKYRRKHAASITQMLQPISTRHSHIASLGNHHLTGKIRRMCTTLSGAHNGREQHKCHPLSWACRYHEKAPASGTTRIIVTTNSQLLF